MYIIHTVYEVLCKRHTDVLGRSYYQGEEKFHFSFMMQCLRTEYNLMIVFAWPGTVKIQLKQVLFPYNTKIKKNPRLINAALLLLF